eukprot:TRINITY_DN14904_c0_g1_i1.p1 TRINITY_DN14904_c0_g1~~TRINITY_DN14904_c0_g1_i1.p1  ORF type:complete len:310 (-),score=102.48 TRINITY_DN14904_c0_g1_i1:154-1083(-)
MINQSRVMKSELRVFRNLFTKMLSLDSTVEMNNGRRLPIVGYGTYELRGEVVYQGVLTALKHGYRHIDTAQIYRNEELVGNAIRDSGLPRDQIFVTSKVSPANQGYEQALLSVEESLRKLQMPYIDLMLIHWPGVSGRPSQSASNAATRKNTWRALEELHAAGKLKAIGVSNYLARHLDELLASATVVPAVNQCEYHPHLTQKSLIEYCRSKGIVFEAYSTLGTSSSKLLDDPTVKRLASKYRRQPAHVLLTWALQHGIPVLPKSSKPGNIVANIEVLTSWQPLAAEDMATLDAMNKDEHYCWDPHSVE